MDKRISGIDGVYYYIYMPSVFFDWDLNFVNELEQLYPPGLNQLTDNNIPANLFSVGPAIFWFPFFVLAHLLTIIAQYFGADLVADGFSSLYQATVYVANSLYGLAGILLTVLILKLYVKPFPALVSILGIMLASQLTYYFWSMTATSHNISFASTALFLWLLLSRGIIFYTAIAAAMMMLAQWQNALFLLPVVILFMNQIILSVRAGSNDWRLVVRKHFMFSVVVLLGLLPQFMAWWLIFGKSVLIPQGSGFFNFGELWLFPVLFSLQHGLFSWHPILLIAFLGIFYLWNKHRILAFSFIGIFILQWILNASLVDWSGGWSFGHRRFINLLPIFALGLALVISEVKQLAFRAILLLLVLLLAVWNQLFIYQYIHGLIPRENAITSQQMFIDKFNLGEILQQKKHINAAIFYLKKGITKQENINQMKLHAKLAYEINPLSLRSNVFYSFACILSKDDKEGYKVFQSWYNLEPRDMLVKYTLAGYLIGKGKNEAAAKLFSASGCSENDSALCNTIKSKILSNERIISDQDFFNLYIKRINNIIRD